MTKDNKVTSVTVRFDPALARELKALAARKHCAVSFLVREAVRTHVEAQAPKAVAS